MTFRQFVANNVLRNKRLYIAYFLSSMFTVMVFFTFAIFAFHPVLRTADVNNEALTGMAAAGGIIYVFSFFFVLYSMGSFLQSRKKEFGLLMMHGMSMRQIRFMVFLENMLIGLGATLLGTGVGTLFAKMILLIGENVLTFEEPLRFYVPFWPMLITFGSFMLLFLVISISVTFILRSKKLTALIKGSNQPKEEPKASIFLTVLGVVLVAAGYAVALFVKGSAVVLVMIPVIFVVIIGTYFLFTQASVYAIRFLKRRKSIFWKKTNMIVLSDLSFRMKDNARTFFMVAIISTVAFSAIGTLVGFQTFLTGGIKEASPYTFTYMPPYETEDADEELARIKQLMEEKNVQADSFDTEIRYYEGVSGEPILIANESTYNALAALAGESELTINENEVVAVEESVRMIDSPGSGEPIPDQPIELVNGDRPTVERTIQSEVLPAMYVHYVVSDALYEQLPAHIETDHYYAWKVTNGEKEDIIAIGETAQEEDIYMLQAIDYMEYSINKVYGPVLLIGLFIGLVFFVSAGSFLYFRLYMDVADDKEKFAAIAKMGLTDKELKKILTRQTAVLFFAPMIVALMHGAVALTALAHLFDYDLTKQSSLVLGSFLVIQMIYFFVVRYVYIKQVKNAI